MRCAAASERNRPGRCSASDSAAAPAALPGSSRSCTSAHSERTSMPTPSSVSVDPSATLRNTTTASRPKLLCENVKWLSTHKDRVRPVGAKGTGKSTSLKAIGGFEALEYGAITRAKGISAGYLPQDGRTLSGRTVFDECMSV